MTRRRLVIAAVSLAGVLLAVWAVSLLGGGSPIDSADDDGYLGLRLLLEGRGAKVTEVDGSAITAKSRQDFDVVFVLEPAHVDRDQLAAWHHYVAAGGRLVLGQPDTDRPDDAAAPDLAEVMAPGACNAFEGTLPTVHTGGAVVHHVHAGESSCYGNTVAALVTRAECRAGEQFTLSSPALFANNTMGAPTARHLEPSERGNAALAVEVLMSTAKPRVGIVTDGVRPSFTDEATPSKGEPRCVGAGTPEDPDAIWRTRDGSTTGQEQGTSRGGGSAGSGGSAGGGSTDGGGTQGGSGSREQDGGRSAGGSNGSPPPPPTIWDFIPTGLKLALAQLFAVLLWYAWRRSRRDGVVVEDHKPVELRSSRLVEAVGALRRRGGEYDRAGADLRRRTRAQVVSALKLPPDASPETVAAAVAERLGRDPAEIESLLDGRRITSEDELMHLGRRLSEVRAALTAAVAMAPHSTSATPSFEQPAGAGTSR